jgi:hypothetical protein
VQLPIGRLTDAESGFLAETAESVISRESATDASYIIVRLSFVNA